MPGASEADFPFLRVRRRRRRGRCCRRLRVSLAPEAMMECACRGAIIPACVFGGGRWTGSGCEGTVEEGILERWTLRFRL